jgi:hypothetical protein
MTSIEVLMSTRNEKLLLTAALDQARYDVLARRSELPASVRARLAKMARTGQMRPYALLERDDLSEDDLVQVTRHPSMDARLAEMVVRHGACSPEALGELSVSELRRKASRTAQGLNPSAARSGHVLGVLRSTNALTRVAAILVDEDVTDDAKEVAEVVRAVRAGGTEALELFLSLVKAWRGSAPDLAYAITDATQG